MPVSMAVVMTPATHGPIANGKIIAFLLTAAAHFWATLAVVGMQDTAAIPTRGLKGSLLILR